MEAGDTIRFVEFEDIHFRLMSDEEKAELNSAEVKYQFVVEPDRSRLIDIYEVPDGSLKVIGSANTHERIYTVETAANGDHVLYWYTWNDFVDHKR